MEPAHPSVVDPTHAAERPDFARSLFDRLLERRVAFLRGPVEGEVVDELCAELIAMDAQSEDDVTLLVDCPGGSVRGALAIHDVVQSMGGRVHTRCVGSAVSAGAIVLASGTGVREATASARIVLDQPTEAVEGTTSEVQRGAAELERLTARVRALLVERTGQTVERIRADTARPLWLSADEAREYGLVDRIVSSAR